MTNAVVKPMMHDVLRRLKRDYADVGDVVCISHLYEAAAAFNGCHTYAEWLQQGMPQPPRLNVAEARERVRQRMLHLDYTNDQAEIIGWALYDRWKTIKH